MMPRSSSGGRLNIAAVTNKIDVDSRISIRYYYRIADNILKQADIFREEKNVTDLYVMLLRYSSLVTETIPYHQEYRTSSQSNKLYLKRKLESALTELEELKPAVQTKLQELQYKQIYEVSKQQISQQSGTLESSVEWPAVRRNWNDYSGKQMAGRRLTARKSVARRPSVTRYVEWFRAYEQEAGEDLAQFLAHYHRLWCNARVTDIEGIMRLLDVLPDQWQGWAREASYFYICQHSVTFELMGNLPEFIALLMHQYLTKKVPPPGPYTHFQGYLRRDEPPRRVYDHLTPSIFSAPAAPPESVVQEDSDFLPRQRYMNDHETGPSCVRRSDSRFSGSELPSRKHRAVSGPPKRIIECVHEVHDQRGGAGGAAAADRLMGTVESESEEEEDPSEDPEDGQTASSSSLV